MKRIICLLLCLALMLPLAALGIGAEEEVEFYKVRISAGEGYCVEKAILEKDELYIPAENFARYTHYEFDSETNIFLVKGQELKKAFKFVKIYPEEKQLVVGGRWIDLKNCYMVDGQLYLPLCQMLPILNAMIVYAEERTINIASEELTMAHLMYGFDVNDYFFDLSQEFANEKGEGQGLLMAYWLPSYLFDSVTDFRLDRLDFFFNSGTFHDYQEILCGYLRNDDLFERANELIDDPETILRLVTGINEKTEGIYDVVDWYHKMEKLSGNKLSDLNEDALDQLLNSKTNMLTDYNADISELFLAVHEENNGVSFAEVFELFYYVYTCCTMVEDNYKMLDVVYNLSGGLDCIDAQYRAAMDVYHLYGENVVVAMGERIGKEKLSEWLKDSVAGKKMAVYELTAKAAGAAWELVIPGDTGDVSVLTLHAGVSDTARMSAVACDMSTEASVEDYRLSLILMMLASRECYKIMADTFEGYGKSAAYYREKIEKLENMIIGLYQVARNQHLDAYENFGTYAEQNRKYLKEAGFFRNPEPMAPGEIIGPEESVYLDFLARHPEYRYYALLDINQDGVDELLASEENGDPHSYADLFIYTGGGFTLGWENIWAKYERLTYSPENGWIEEKVGGTGGCGYWFYSMDTDLTVQWTGYEWYDWSGPIYNGEIVTDEAIQEAYNELMVRHHSGTSVEIEFLPVPSDGNPYLEFLQAHPEYRYYALLDINQDGCDELLASEIGIPEDQRVDLWIYRDGGFVLGQEDIWAVIVPLSYNPGNRWVENMLIGAMGGGMEFFYLDDELNVVWESFEDYAYEGEFYNGKPLEDSEDAKAYQRLKDAYDPETSEEIIFQPAP